MLQTYLNRIHDVAQKRGARKDYFYWSLGNLVRDYAEESDLEDVRIIVLADAGGTVDHKATNPAMTGARSDVSGAADLRIENGAGDPIGYIRTIAPDADLEDLELDGRRDDVTAGGSNDTRAGGDINAGGPSELSNLLLTNFYGFRLFQEGALKEAVTIFPPTADADESAQASDDEKAAFSRLIRAFLQPA